MILVVDDDMTMQRLLCKQLEFLGLHADTASNGGDALERVMQRPYRLILMDVQMPLMDGYEATRLIRCLEEKLQQRSVPIIAVTSIPDRQLCIEAGMTEFLQKPVELEKLKLLLQRRLEL